MKPNPPDARPARALRLVVDNDRHKGAMEEDRPGADRSAHPGLDSDGLPNDPVAIAQDAVASHAVPEIKTVSSLLRRAEAVLGSWIPRTRAGVLRDRGSQHGSYENGEKE